MGEELESVLSEVRALRRADRSRNLSTLLLGLLEREWAPGEAAVIRGELIGEHQHHGQYAEALQCLLAQEQEEPGEPYYSLSLAEHFHYYDVDLERSLLHITDAIRKARLDGKFLYQSLGVQARVCIETQRWALLEESLRELAAYEHKPGNVDVFPETDFLPRIPPGTVPQELISAYRDRVAGLRNIGYSTMLGAKHHAA